MTTEELADLLLISRESEAWYTRLRHKRIMFGIKGIRYGNQIVYDREDVERRVKKYIERHGQ